IGMVLHSQLKEFLRLVKLARVAMELSQFISGVGIAGLDFQFRPELLGRRSLIVWRVALPGTGQQGSPYPVMNARPQGISRKHLTILADGRVVRSLAFVGFSQGLMPPDRPGGDPSQLLHGQEGEV